MPKGTDSTSTILKNMRPFHWIMIIIGIASILIGYRLWEKDRSYHEIHHRILTNNPREPIHHIYDHAHVLFPDYYERRLDDYMETILQESDVDLRFVTIQGTGPTTIEDLATSLVDELQVGAKTRHKRGMLFLFDTEKNQMKVEVGYGLEGYFPDIFIHYLINRHLKMFFEYDNKLFGIQLLVRMLHHRIREAILGDDFDPRVLDILTNEGRLSGGAGVSSTMQAEKIGRPFPTYQLREDERHCYAAQKTPAETYAVYMQWISQPIFDPQVDIFTKDSQRYLSRLPISPAYSDFIILCEFGKRYHIVERQDLAILYFTSTPFTTPLFFIKQHGVWRMDIMAEVLNAHEVLGKQYTWTYTGENDIYTRAFGDLLNNFQGSLRFRDGDNRPLVIRSSRE